MLAALVLLTGAASMLSVGCAFCPKKAAAEVVPPPAPALPQPAQPSCLAVYAETQIPNMTNEYVVKGDSLDRLKLVAACLAANPNARVRIDSHADIRGTSAYNQALSQRRADAAKDVLVGNGVSSSRIDIVAHGENDPIAHGTTAEDLAQNRITFVIILQ